MSIINPPQVNFQGTNLALAQEQCHLHLMWHLVDDHEEMELLPESMGVILQEVRGIFVFFFSLSDVSNIFFYKTLQYYIIII